MFWVGLVALGYGPELMITGVHAILFTRDADALRAFLRDVLELPSVDAGGGWADLRPPARRARRPPGRASPARRSST